ncbi:MAG: TRAM domain-containing protein [Syntrophomonadaceae bacterium]|nr:TRAM domain-containing protein [Syntrophomonadaceae bacterium]
MHIKQIILKILILALVVGTGIPMAINNSATVSLIGKTLMALSIILVACFLVRASIAFIKKGIGHLNLLIESTSVEVLLGGAGGLVVGTLIGVLSSFPLSAIKGLGPYLTLGIFIFCGYLGLSIGVRRGVDMLGLFPPKGNFTVGNPDNGKKILDTSAIIDGRIYDVCASNFLEGSLLVPTAVIDELQHIADSSDHIRRNKGRRGLELLAKMQKHPKIKIDIIDSDIVGEKEVDSKLIKLCKQLNASIITNDYNLNKVAELQGIKVLNINELTNAVKIVVYPGETMHINIIKEGKESGQGVGYLEDGTMVVVEDANDEIGRELDVMVTSVFQTAAGRMIFTRKIKDDNHPDLGSFHDVQEVKMFG